ncbi:MAG: hypothetical protein EOO39_21490 [Cytophagaceae bacterium]|nr:MAG: hypothetical protein EOO39_21490 [Cytophagaceae bacterium]
MCRSGGKVAKPQAGSLEVGLVGGPCGPRYLIRSVGGQQPLPQIGQNGGINVTTKRGHHRLLSTWTACGEIQATTGTLTRNVTSHAAEGLTRNYSPIDPNLFVCRPRYQGNGPRRIKSNLTPASNPLTLKESTYASPFSPSPH